nr:hypothetical protein [Tanacetum cinerariifolium]
MVEKSKLDKDKEGKAVDPSHYRGMIGTLLYLTSSRPDLQFAICMCARYQAQPTEKHLHAVTPTKHGRMTKPYSSHRFIANCFNARHLKMGVKFNLTASPIHALGGYSRPSHDGYRNTIELSDGNNVVPLRSDTIRTAKLHNDILMFQQHQAPRTSSTHVPQAYAEAISLDPHPRNLNELPKKKPFTFHERFRPGPQPQALETSFKARVRDYMAAHTKRMKRLKNDFFKQREEINCILADMFGLLKELTTS